MLNKFWTALVGTLAMLAHGLLTDDGVMSAYDWVSFTIQGGTAALVWYIANGPKGTINWVSKFVAAAWTAAGALMLPAFVDGVVTGEEWGKIGVAGVTAILVLIIGNRPAPVTPSAPGPLVV